MTPMDAADRANRRHRTIRLWLFQGRIRRCDTPGCDNISVESLERFLENKKAVPALPDSAGLPRRSCVALYDPEPLLRAAWLSGWTRQHLAQKARMHRTTVTSVLEGTGIRRSVRRLCVLLKVNPRDVMRPCVRIVEYEDGAEDS